MGTFIAYIIKVAFCLLFFFVFNKLIFNRDTFHKFIRIAWLAIIPVSLILPLFSFGIWNALFSGEGIVVGEPLIFSEVTHYEAGAASTESPLFSLVLIVALIYGVGMIAMALFFIVSYLRMFRSFHLPSNDFRYCELLHDCMKLVGYDGKVKIVVHQRDMAPFSWMNYIVISEKDIKEDGREILIHELSHVRHGHSWDLIAADLLIVFQWFNPASYLIKRSLQQVHEYAADESVIDSGIDAKQYQLLLIKKAVGNRLYSIANSFNHSKLKNRITMMLKEKSSKWAYVKCLYALPLALIAGGAFATPRISSALNDISSVKITQISETPDIPDTIVPVTPQEEETMQFALVEEKPSFQGGDANAFSKWVGENMVYPAEAKAGNTQGRITLQFTIETDGSLTNGRVLHSNVSGDQTKAVLLENEALRVLSSSPKWTPGRHKGKLIRVVYNFPVIFALTDDSAPVTFSEAEEKPSFQGGDANDFSKWIGRNLVYPAKAKKNRAQGRVVVQFTIDTDGSITNVNVLRGINPELDAEAVRVISSAPKWTPGKIGGKLVKVTYNFPVLFQLR